MSPNPSHIPLECSIVFWDPDRRRLDSGEDLDFGNNPSLQRVSGLFFFFFFL